MKTEMYSIYDKMSRLFGVPFPAINRACAVRSFTEQLKNTDLGKRASDYELFYVGQYDDEKGQYLYTGELLPEFVVNGLSFCDATGIIDFSKFDIVDYQDRIDAVYSEIRDALCAKLYPDLHSELTAYMRSALSSDAEKLSDEVVEVV